jgi:ATP-dependent DNA ligase
VLFEPPTHQANLPPALVESVETFKTVMLEGWLKLLPGIEGVVAKRRDGRYLPGQREWIKVKRKRTAGCVVIGVEGDITRPRLVLGLRHADSRIHHFGLARLSSAILTDEFRDPCRCRPGGKPDPIALATCCCGDLAPRSADCSL